MSIVLTSLVIVTMPAPDLIGGSPSKAGDKEQDFVVPATPGASASVRTNRRYEDLPPPRGWLVDTAPGAWIPRNSPEYYCEWIQSGPARADDEHYDVVQFWFRVGDLRRIAQQMSGGDEGSVAMHRVVGIVMADAIGAHGISWLGLPADLHRVKDADDDKFVVHGITAGRLAGAGGSVPGLGPHQYPAEPAIYKEMLALSANDELVATLPGEPPYYVPPTPQPGDAAILHLGAFVDWFADQVGRPDRDSSALADARLIYYILHDSSSVQAIELNLLFDILSEDAAHTREVHEIYDRGAGVQDAYLDLVSDLVNYAETIREVPDRGNARNYLLYLLAHAQAEVRDYAVRIHQSQRLVSPFEIEAVFADTRDGVHEVPAQATTWFRLHVYDDDETHSLFDIHDDESFTVSWYVERERRPGRVEMPGVGQGRSEDGEGFLSYLNDDSASRPNPLYSHHSFSVDDIQVPQRVVCMITWYERIYEADRADGYTTKPHVHYIEQPVRVLSVEDSLVCDLDESMSPRVGRSIANWRSYSAVYQMVPTDIADDLRSQVLADDALPAHRVILTSSNLQRVSEDQPEGYCASFLLQSTGETTDATGTWFVASTNDEYHQYDRIFGQDVSSRLQPDVRLRQFTARRWEYVFAVRQTEEYSRAVYAFRDAHPRDRFPNLRSHG